MWLIIRTLYIKGASPPPLEASNLIILNHSFNNDAFRPKAYAVRIEKGNFTEPCYIGSSSSYRPRFAIRLLFNKSLYPPRSEWREPEGGPDGGQFWDYKEFVGRSSPELEKQGRAMNDLAPAGWATCVIS